MSRKATLTILIVFVTVLLIFSVAVYAQTGDEETGEGDAPPPAAEEQPDAEKPDDTAIPQSDAVDTEVTVEKINPEKLEAYEQDLDKLKERIFKSKARLMQLYEQLKLGSVSIVGISIKHTHKVGSTFKLESITYTLDGFEVYHAENDAQNSLEQLAETPVYEGSLLPGEHILVVDMVYRGKGYGIFSYLDQYLFNVKSRYTFTVEEGEVVNVSVTSLDEGSFLAPLKDRLRLRFVRE